MERLKEKPRQAQKTQEEVARAAQVSQPSYANIEAGRRMPSVPTAKRIAAALGFDWKKFYEDPAETEAKETPA